MGRNSKLGVLLRKNWTLWKAELGKECCTILFPFVVRLNIFLFFKLGCAKLMQGNNNNLLPFTHTAPPRPPFFYLQLCLAVTGMGISFKSQTTISDLEKGVRAYRQILTF